MHANELPTALVPAPTWEHRLYLRAREDPALIDHVRSGHAQVVVDVGVEGVAAADCRQDARRHIVRRGSASFRPGAGCIVRAIPVHY